MFGILYMLSNTITKVIGKVKTSIDDDISMKNTYDNFSRTYVDSHGKMIDLDSGRIVVCVVDENNHMVIKDAHNGKTIRDLTLLRNKQREIDAINKNNSDITHIRIVEKNDHHMDNVKGYRYKDIKTGKIYVMRQVYNVEFGTIDCLMDMETHRLVRLSDYTIRELKHYNEDISKYEDYIERLNNNDRRTYGVVSIQNLPRDYDDYKEDYNLKDRRWE